MFRVHPKLSAWVLAFLILLPLPIMILNSLGGFISGLWLLFLGEWGTLFKGLLLMMVSGLLVSIALMPSLAFLSLAKAFVGKGHKVLAVFFGACVVLYRVALMALWCIFVMWFFLHSVEKSAEVPALIWSYGVALAPWSWLARKDRLQGNRSAIFTTFLAQVSYIIAMIMFANGAALHMILGVFLLIMLMGAVLQMLISLMFRLPAQEARF